MKIFIPGLKKVFILSLLFVNFITNAAFSQGPAVKYFDRGFFLIEGTSIPEAEKESPFDRLPASYKEKVRPAVWSLSKSSAGITIRFLSNSSSLSVKWELLDNAIMNHMAPTGIKGIDLYCKKQNNWVYVNTARPTGKTNEALLINNMEKGMREYKMYLPLYDGVISLEVGIDSLSVITKPAPDFKKPIVFYGTSITQGGCASRPGMAYTNIISRKLGIDCINLGFSGNGKMEKPLAELISGIDAEFFVIDCTPNMKASEIHQNAIPLVQIIRSRHKTTPIVFVENVNFAKSFFEDTTKNRIDGKNKMLRDEYEKMVRDGFREIYYIDNLNALGTDNEATVDGVHFTDLGFMRFSEFLIERFRKLKLIR